MIHVNVRDNVKCTSIIKVWQWCPQLVAQNEQACQQETYALIACYLVQHASVKNF